MGRWWEGMRWALQERDRDVRGAAMDVGCEEVELSSLWDPCGRGVSGKR